LTYRNLSVGFAGEVNYMIVKKTERDLESESPEILDEGWWSAVLSDEESIVAPGRETAGKTTPQPAVTIVDWELVQGVFERDEIVSLKVQGFNRGGLLVQGRGVQGFVPISHLIEMPTSLQEDERRSILAAYVDRMIDVKVIECDPSQERIVLSERAALAGEGQRRALFETLQEGAVLRGRVTNVTDFGAFIDLGGLEGLVHVSELSWGRVQHPSEILDVNDEVRVLILQVNEEISRIALSMKRLAPNPWEALANRYNPGDIVPARITSMTRFGAFARLEEGVEGLIHVSSMKMPPNCRSVEQYLDIGQEVNVRILHIDTDRRRLGLGLVMVE
jgi:small subunit ribosomal protein S1